MEKTTQYFSLVFTVWGLLMIYTILLVTKVFKMKNEEDFLRQYGKPKELQDFLKKKNLRHILTLGIL